MLQSDQLQDLRPLQTGFWALPFNIAAFLLSVAVLAIAGTGIEAAKTGGFVYPLDDAYIHLALARNFASTGLWGLYPGIPAAASSSPLWIVILTAAYKIAPSAGDLRFSWLPFFLNVLAGLAYLWLLSRIFANTRAPTWYSLIAWVVIPLPAMAFIGMEHVLHVLAATALAWVGASMLAKTERPRPDDLVALGLLSALAVATRYESLFVVAALGMLAALRLRWRIAIVLGVSAALPVFGFGVIWIIHGGWLLPNSLLLKGFDASAGYGPNIVDGFVRTLVFNVQRNMNRIGCLLMIGMALLAVIVAAERFVWRTTTGKPSTSELFSWVVVLTTFIDILAGSTRWLFRYEAWVVGLLAVAFCLVFDRLAARRLWLAGAIAVVLLALALPRAGVTMLRAAKAPTDRLWEHFLPMDFVNANYHGETVAVNDVGVMAYYGDGPAIDIYGLGDNEPVRLRRSPAGYHAEQMRGFVASTGAKLAILQVCWDEIANRVPDSWTLVGVMKGPRNVVFYDFLVGFFAFDDAGAARLQDALKQFPREYGITMLDRTNPLIQKINAAADRGVAARTLCH